MNYYLIHGLLQFVAFIILFPIGAMIALLRNSIGPSWRKYHVFFQLTGTVTVIIAIISIVYAKSQSIKKKEKEENMLRKIHKLLGPIVVTVIFVQILWAYYGRRLVEWNTWYTTHMMFSMFIIFGGISNVILGLQM